MADGKIASDETLLMGHLVRLVRERHQVADEKLARLIDVYPVEVWRRLDAEPGDLSDLLDVANRVANVDGAVNARERGVTPSFKIGAGESDGGGATGRPGQITGGDSRAIPQLEPGRAEGQGERAVRRAQELWARPSRRARRV